MVQMGLAQNQHNTGGPGFLGFNSTAQQVQLAQMSRSMDFIQQQHQQQQQSQGLNTTPMMHSGMASQGPGQSPLASSMASHSNQYSEMMDRANRGLFATRSLCSGQPLLQL